MGRKTARNAPPTGAVFDHAHNPAAAELLDQFLRSKRYTRALALRLLSAGRQRDLDWPVRRLAALMLQCHLLELAPDDLDEHDFLFCQFGIKPEIGREVPVRAGVLREGFSQPDLLGFIVEFRRKLAGPDQLFRLIRGGARAERHLPEFLAYARQECRLVLARYLFTPAEVVEQIQRQVRTSRGIRQLVPQDQELIDGERDRFLNALPDYEAAIVRGLLEQSDRVYWVADQTPSEINSLVEAPLGTVALAVKLPGSDLEIELKRAGRRGPRPLNVVFERDGVRVPPSHRLDAGSRAWSLHWEARSSAFLARVYRLAHQSAPPISTVLSVNVIHTIPNAQGEAHLLTYFTDPAAFGPGFDLMRAEMKKVVAAGESEQGQGLPGLAGEVGQTVKFLQQFAPGAGILGGTTSFRLDRLNQSLSPCGADFYFKTGLGRPYSDQEAKAFADALLEQVLGCFTRPLQAWSDHGSYVTEAFAQPSNRRRADRIYWALLQEIARFWGTLLAIRGYANGESFVIRNVGLRTAWENGEWQVHIVFMDHDDLQLPGPDSKHVSPRSVWDGTQMDARHILDQPEANGFQGGEVPVLQSIYRVSSEVVGQGTKLFDAALASSYRQTQQALPTKPDLRALFHKSFIERLGDWDQAVALFLHHSEGDPWEPSIQAFLTERGYSEEQVADSIAAIKKHDGLLRQLSSLFLGPLEASE